MRSIYYKFSIIIFSICFAFSCANRGTPQGGEIDTDPPEIVKSIPKIFLQILMLLKLKFTLMNMLKLKMLKSKL